MPRLRDKVWKNLPDQTTPVTADDMNFIEEHLYNVFDQNRIMEVTFSEDLKKPASWWEAVRVIGTSTVYENVTNTGNLRLGDLSVIHGWLVEGSTEIETVVFASVESTTQTTATATTKAFLMSGVSPVITSERRGSVTTVSYGDVTGVHSFDINDGFSPLLSAVREGKVTHVTVTDADGTRTFDINDGFSPIVSVSKVGVVTTISITDESGTHTARINDGSGGDMYKYVYDTDNDGKVENADHADSADQATNADNAAYASEAAHAADADHADEADEADHALSADNAARATTAGTADNALKLNGVSNLSITTKVLLLTLSSNMGWMPVATGGTHNVIYSMPGLNFDPRGAYSIEAFPAESNNLKALNIFHKYNLKINLINQVATSSGVETIFNMNSNGVYGNEVPFTDSSVVLKILFHFQGDVPGPLEAGGKGVFYNVVTHSDPGRMIKRISLTLNAANWTLNSDTGLYEYNFIQSVPDEITAAKARTVSFGLAPDQSADNFKNFSKVQPMLYDVVYTPGEVGPFGSDSTEAYKFRAMSGKQPTVNLTDLQIIIEW